MAVQIDSMRSQVDILPPSEAERGGTGTGTGPGESLATGVGAGDMAELKRILGPVVLELVAEELTTYMKMRG